MAKQQCVLPSCRVDVSTEGTAPARVAVSAGATYVLTWACCEEHRSAASRERRRCKVCPKTFVLERNPAGGRPKIFCSSKCQKRADQLRARAWKAVGSGRLGRMPLTDSATGWRSRMERLEELWFAFELLTEDFKAARAAGTPEPAETLSRVAEVKTGLAEEIRHAHREVSRVTQREREQLALNRDHEARGRRRQGQLDGVAASVAGRLSHLPAADELGGDEDDDGI